MASTRSTRPRPHGHRGQVLLHNLSFPRLSGDHPMEVASETLGVSQNLHFAPQADCYHRQHIAAPSSRRPWPFDKPAMGSIRRSDNCLQAEHVLMRPEDSRPQGRKIDQSRGRLTTAAQHRGGGTVRQYARRGSGAQRRAQLPEADGTETNSRWLLRAGRAWVIPTKLLPVDEDVRVDGDHPPRPS